MQHKKTLFFDASVWGGYYDDVFTEDTRKLFHDVKSGMYSVIVSDLVIEELENAPQKIKDLLKEIKHRLVEVTDECKSLADEYIKEKVVGETNKNDCNHISTATINNIDYLVSWNFKHIVNVGRIDGYNSVNMRNGYKCLEIRSPREFRYI